MEKTSQMELLKNKHMYKINSYPVWDLNITDLTQE